MTQARSSKVDLNATPYYHLMNRCVRRTYLCGEDKQTGRSYEHRRAWIEDRLFYLAKYFCIDICAYAIMHNHYHIVVHVNQDEAKHLSTVETLERWSNIYNLRTPETVFLRGGSQAESMRDRAEEAAAKYKERLCNISEFMAALNFFISKMANAEDKVTGHFWEGRFKSQALLDEKALAAAMAYVDLNPIRAAIADTPEESEYTSIKLRAAIRKENKQPKQLMPFAGNPTNEDKYGLPFELDDYLQLVDWSGRQFDERKRGKIDWGYPDILDRLSFDNKEWLYMTKNFESKFKNLVGTAYSVRRACEIFCRRPPPLSELIS